MSPNYPREKAPANLKHFETVLSDAEKSTSRPARRMRHWISCMAILGALQRAQAKKGPDERRLLLKGGVAMELRLQLEARATKDLDLVFHGPIEALLEDLDAALAEPYSGFSFERTEAVQNPNHPDSYRFDVKLFYGERRESWQTLQVEGSPAEGNEGELAEGEDIPAIGIDDFGIDGPELIPCLSLRYQIAQKLHACSERFPDKENDRSRDLIDLILLRRLLEDGDLPGVREACVKTFAHRKKHRWPPDLGIEPSWSETYAADAEKYNFDVKTVEEAVEQVHAFIEEIDDAK